MEGKEPTFDMSYGTIICLINECYSQKGEFPFMMTLKKHFIFPLRNKIVAKDVYNLFGKRVLLKKFGFRKCTGRDQAETISEDARLFLSV